jgi:hypothetical protein
VAKGIKLLANETGQRHRARDITNSLAKLWSAWKAFLVEKIRIAKLQPKIQNIKLKLMMRSYFSNGVSI